VDLFTDQEHGVEAAADAVEAALRGAGFAVDRQKAGDGGLADIFPDPGEGLAEWVVSTPGGAQMVVQLACFDRSREPVVMEIGPVPAVADVAGGKVRAGEPGRATRLRRYRADAGTLQPGRADRLRPAPRPRYDRPRLRRRRPATRPHRRRGIHPVRPRAREVAVVREPFQAWPRTADAAAVKRRSCSRAISIELTSGRVDRGCGQATPPRRANGRGAACHQRDTGDPLLRSARI
jgi:hypothetical protein